MKNKKGVYFLDNNEEVKIISKTTKEQLFITNKSNKILIEDYFTYRERTIKESNKILAKKK